MPATTTGPSTGPPARRAVTSWWRAGASTATSACCAARTLVPGRARGGLAASSARRWQAAGGGELDVRVPRGPGPEVEPCLEIPPGPVALSRTQTEDPAPAREIRQLFLDAIGSAERL